MQYQKGDRVRFTNNDKHSYEVERQEGQFIQLLGTDRCHYHVSMFQPVEAAMPEDNQVVKPAHYQNSLGIQVIDIINEYFHDNYNLGNVVKYLLRADKKGARQQDLEKALQYLTWEVDRGR